MAYSINAKDYFNTKLYTGTGSSNALTGVGFSPDLIWTATRNEAEILPMNDSVNGINNYLRSNASDTLETAGSNITAQSSDGYTVGTENRFNQSSNTFVSWNWKANGAGSANTDGSINTTATSANTTSGFSISKYTGTGSNATVGHGLGSVPAVIMVKNLGGTDSWMVYHKNSNATPEDYILQLNTTGAAVDNNTIWNDTAPTSSVFSIGTDAGVNGSSATYIAYAFAEKTGFSKFGSYTGTGNADGPFIYTGFKPAWFLWKPYNATDSWNVVDSKRVGYNPDNNRLFPNLSNEEDTQDRVDLVSNGMKIRTSDGGTNSSSRSYIYMAFAEAPLVGTNNIAATAR